MKNTKTILFLLIGLTLTFVGGIIMYARVAEIKSSEYVILAVIGLLVLFGIGAMTKKLRDEQKGLVVEDELSQQIKQKAAASSFISSFYLWTLLLLFTMDSSISHEILIGIGIVGMSLIFLGFWVYHKNRGIAHENPN